MDIAKLRNDLPNVLAELTVDVLLLLDRAIEAGIEHPGCIKALAVIIEGPDPCKVEINVCFCQPKADDFVLADVLVNKSRDKSRVH